MSSNKMMKAKAATKELDREGSSAALKLMAQKPKLIAPQVLVQDDYDTLLVVLQHGYTYTEIAKTYGEHGVKVTPAQLKVQFEALQAQKEKAEALTRSEQKEPDERLTDKANSTKIVVKSAKRTADEEAAQMALTEG